MSKNDGMKDEHSAESVAPFRVVFMARATIASTLGGGTGCGPWCASYEDAEADGLRRLAAEEWSTFTIEKSYWPSKSEA